MDNIYSFLIYIIISLVLLLLIKYFYCHEKFTIDNKQITHDTHKHNKQYHHKIDSHKNIQHINDSDPLHKFIGHDKIINLTTTFSGKKYVLSSYPKEACSNYDKIHECLSNILVLIDFEDHQKNLIDLQQKNQEKEKLCQLNYQIKCQNEIKKNSINTNKHNILNNYPQIHNQKNIENFTNTIDKTDLNNIDTIKLRKDLDECSKIPIECITMPYTNSDFNLINVYGFDKNSKLKTYKLIGRVTNYNNSLSRYSISMAGDYTPLDLVCLDGGTLDNTPFSTLEIIEVPNKSGSEPKYILRIKHQSTIGGKHLLHDRHGKPIYEYKFVGLCQNNTCKMNNKNYHRLCLYDKETNPFVLEFEINIVDLNHNNQVTK